MSTGIARRSGLFLAFQLVAPILQAIVLARINIATQAIAFLAARRQRGCSKKDKCDARGGFARASHAARIIPDARGPGGGLLVDGGGSQKAQQNAGLEPVHAFVQVLRALDLGAGESKLGVAEL